MKARDLKIGMRVIVNCPTREVFTTGLLKGKYPKHRITGGLFPSDDALGKWVGKVGVVIAIRKLPYSNTSIADVKDPDGRLTAFYWPVVCLTPEVTKVTKVTKVVDEVVDEVAESYEKIQRLRKELDAEQARLERLKSARDHVSDHFEAGAVFIDNVNLQFMVIADIARRRYTLTGVNGNFTMAWNIGGIETRDDLIKYLNERKAKFLCKMKFTVKV